MTEGIRIDYPFPIQHGEWIARLQLPIEGLSKEDADRLSAFIQTLVTEQEEDE